MSDLKVAIANCLIGGEGVSTSSDGGWTRNHVRLRLAGFTLDVYQHPDVIEDHTQFIGQFVHSTDLYVREIGADEIERAEVVVDDLCFLLRFATASQVVPIRYEYEEREWSHSVIGRALLFRPVIELRDGTVVREFVERTWERFQNEKARRKLREVFDYLVTADLPEQPIEVRLLLGFIILENLKSTYARCEGYPKKKDRYRDPESGKVLTFEELLVAMFGKQEMQVQLPDLIKWRNQMVHFGLSEDTRDNEMMAYEAMRSTIQEYLLRVIGYVGRYHHYRAMDYREM